MVKKFSPDSSSLMSTKVFDTINIVFQFEVIALLLSYRPVSTKIEPRGKLKGKITGNDPVSGRQQRS